MNYKTKFLIGILVFLFSSVIYAQAQEEECPPGTEPRNCGGSPPKCDCFKWDGEKGEWVKVGERPIKPGDYLTVNTVLDKDYKGLGTFYLDKDGMVFDGNGYTLDGITIYSNKNGVTIKNCVIINNRGDGIHLDGSSGSTIKDNTIKSCSTGIYLDDSSNCNVIGNTAESNSFAGILLSGNSSNNNLTNNKVNSNWNGISISGSSNTLTSNTVNSNNMHGVDISNAGNNNTLIDNIVNSNSDGGIRIFDTNYVTLQGNTANLNQGYSGGIHLSSSDDGTSSNHTLTNNTANSNSDMGIFLEFASNCKLTGNTMSGNKANFGVYGWALAEYTHDIDTSNTVDGKPIYYWFGKQGGQIPLDAGFAGIVNSSGVTAKNLTVAKNYPGLLLAYSTNSTVENITAVGNLFGIFLYSSSNNQITNNTADENIWNGIYLYKSTDNTVTGNSANSNQDWGMEVRSSHKNTFTENEAKSNGFDGINLWETSNENTFTRNSFMDNGSNGIHLVNGSNLNIIGGLTEDERNIISGNKQSGVKIEYEGTDGNKVLGNYIGTDESGTAAQPNEHNGVEIASGAKSNIIDGNVISGNKQSGVKVDGKWTDGNKVQKNYIGTDKAGTSSLGNTLCGVYIKSAPQNIIGGVSGEGNVISGNSEYGVIIEGSDAMGNKVSGNYIGTDKAGTAALGNILYGVYIKDAPDNIIGGSILESGARNIISGNGKEGGNLSALGVVIEGSTATKNKVQNNYIGIDVTGTKALGNFGHGVKIKGAPENIIGGTGYELANVISGNKVSGIIIEGSTTTGNKVQGNFIGTDKSGQTALGNGSSGVTIQGAPNNIIGGTREIGYNVIAGNNISGITIAGADATANKVQGNFIGTNASGQKVLGNGTSDSAKASSGMYIHEATDNIIGGTEDKGGNVISGNFGYGVWISGSTTKRNKVQNNYIGTDKAGTSKLGNTLRGVYIQNAPENTIGGIGDGTRNVISGNADDDDEVFGHGIMIEGASAAGNKVQNNYIGTDVTGKKELRNYGEAVYIKNAPKNIIGGMEDGARNVISGNALDGIVIHGSNAAENEVLGNFIGPDKDGENVLINGGHGVNIHGAAKNIIGGTESGAGNFISWNSLGGIAIAYSEAANNKVRGNNITFNKIWLYHSSGNVITDNKVESSHGDGISFVSSSQNTISNNKVISNSSYGISLIASNNNTIYNNYFSNENNAYDSGTNNWNIAKTKGENIIGGTYLGGNYWSDYRGNDTDGDGLGDTFLPYNSGGDIKTGGDRNPLIRPIDLSIESQDIVAPEKVEVDTVPAYGEVQIVEITATVHNRGIVDVHNVEVQLNIKFRDKIFTIQKETISYISVGANKTVIFEWEVLQWVKDNLENLWAEEQSGTLIAPVDVEQKPNFVYVEVVVDPKNKILESNETNNSVLAESEKTLLRVIPDVDITTVKAIQVIEDVSLIKDKPMMIRVWAKLWDGKLFAEAHNVKVKVEFDDGNPPQELEMALINRKEGEKYVTYVVPKNEVSRLKSAMGNDRQFNQFLFETGCNAFNFEYTKENNLHPRIEGKLKTRATLQNKDSFADNDTDSSISNVIPCAEKKKEYRILYIPLDSWGTEHQRSIARHKDLMKKHSAFLEATHPVLEVWSYYGYTMQELDFEGDPPEDPDTIASFCAIHCPAAAAYTGSKYCQQGFDSTVYIVPTGALHCFGSEAKGWSFRTGRGVFVDESTFRRGIHTSAHEIGHTWTLSGGTRSEDYDSSELPATKLAAEGWDVTGKATAAMHHKRVYGGTVTRARVNPVKEIGERSLNWKSHMGRASAFLPWITAENYAILVNEFSKNDPRVLLAGGEIHPDGTVDFWPFYSWEGGTDPLQQGDYSFDCVAENGTVLSSYSFEPEKSEETGSSFFGFTILYPEGTSKLILRHDDTILAEKPISLNAPEIIIDSVNDLGDGNYELIWSATDADGEGLEFFFGIRRHDDEPWFPIEGELNQSSPNYTLKFSTSSTPGGDNCRVRITATDGVNTVDAISEPFFVSTKPPSVTIISPADGSIFNQGDDVIFDGLGYDAEEGLLEGSTFVWTSSIDGEIGRGDYFTISNLSLGKHQIALQVTDSEGKTATASANITTADVVINEVYPNPLSEGYGEWIEIHNTSDLAVNLSGCKINDGDGELDYVIPENASDWNGILEAGSYLIIHLSGIFDSSAENLYVNLDSGVLDDDGDSIALFNQSEVALDFIRYGVCEDVIPTDWTGINPEAPVQGQSLGRNKESTDTDDGSDWENTGGVDADVPTPGNMNIAAYMGDVSDDGEITAYDASLILQYLVGKITLSDIQLIAADVSRQGGVTAYDAALILQRAVGLIDGFPAEGDVPSISSNYTRQRIVSVKDVKARKGEIIEVPIIIDDAEGIISGVLKIRFDEEALRFERVEAGNLSEGSYLDHRREGDRIEIAFAGMSQMRKGEGEPIILRFEVVGKRWVDEVKIGIEEAMLNEETSLEIRGGLIGFVPYQTALLQNYPNPFNPETWIPYQLAEDADVSVRIYNVAGRLVREINLSYQRKGYYTSKGRAVYWNGRNDLGERIASGVYFYQMQVRETIPNIGAGENRFVRKLVILK